MVSLRAPPGPYESDTKELKQMATQTKADRQAAAKKAAATRKRNEIRRESSDAGRKAAATRLRDDAAKSVKRARKDLNTAAGNVQSAAKSAGEAAVKTGRSLTARVGIGG